MGFVLECPPFLQEKLNLAQRLSSTWNIDHCDDRGSPLQGFPLLENSKIVFAGQDSMIAHRILFHVEHDCWYLPFREKDARHVEVD